MFWESLEVLRRPKKLVQPLVDDNVKIHKQLKRYVISDAALKEAWETYRRNQDWQRLMAISPSHNEPHQNNTNNHAEES